MLKFDFGPRIPRSKATKVLKLRLNEDLYEIIRRRGLKRGVTVEVSATEYIEDALRHEIDSDFFELQIVPITMSPQAVMMAYAGYYPPMTIEELSKRTRLTKPFLAELSDQGKIPGARQIPRSAPWRYERRAIIDWLLSDEPRLLYQANPRRRVK